MERIYTDYTASGRQITLNNVPPSFSPITGENIRLIFNETQKDSEGNSIDPLVSTGKKENLLAIQYNGTNHTVIITLSDNVPEIISTDKLTIKIDMGDSVDSCASESNATLNKQSILDALSAATVLLQGQDSSTTLTILKQAIQSIDFSALAKQGSNSNATLSETQSQATSAATDAATAKSAALDAKTAAQQAKSAVDAISGFALQGSDSTATNTALMQSLTNIISQHLIIGGQVMDGIEFAPDFTATSAMDVIVNKNKIIKITNNTIETIPSDAIFNQMTSLQEIHMQNVKTIPIGNGFIAGCSSLRILDMPSLTSLYRIGFGMSTLVELNLPNLASVNVISLQNTTGLQRINLPSLTSGFGSNGLSGLNSGGITYINFHNYINGFANQGSGATGFPQLSNCTFLDVTNVNAWNVNMLVNSQYPVNLIDFRIGAGMTNSFALQNYRPINAMRFDTDNLLTDEDRQAGFTSNGEKLLYNLKHYFADNLPDKSDVEYATVTLHQDLYDFIDTYGQDIVETIEDKNWYLIS